MTYERILNYAYHTALAKWAKEDELAKKGDPIAEIKAQKYWEEVTEISALLKAEEDKR